MNEDDYVEGYLDGRDPNAPIPSGNRSPRYVHSFNLGRAEIEGKTLPPAHISRARVVEIEKAEAGLYD